jgi:hypothetical protein
MQEFEKLGLFYLGREYDVDSGRTLNQLILYDSRDLVTHAVCVGMTGSGKTGLCLGLIEEAAIDGVPVIAIDPKGDLGNLLLTFPALTPHDFRPWIDEDAARRAGQTADAYAAAQSEEWKKGLADWGQDGARIERLRKAADFALYTPGSRAGIPISILTSLAAPPSGTDDAELTAERAGGAAASVLMLAGVDAQPRSREHTLVSTLLTTAWRENRDLDLTTLIQQVQSPSFQKVGVIDLESFFPSKDRFDLAMRLNGLLAAPGFDQWLEGQPLDPAALFFTPDGKPRVAIISIAHLNDAERQFFVALLLNEIVAWMRRQAGTSSLRAIVYMDEILGYFPPVANPPSKPPLLTLLKQGRALGIGVVLATQNPVDLDYKGLANTGTWFLGRLQTERDKARVLDGLEGAAAGSLDRAEVDRLLSALGKRVFLLHNVHAAGPVVFQTRWTMSYLRGPLSRDQIRALTVASASSAASSAERAGRPRPSDAKAAKRGVEAAPVRSNAAQPPVVPPGIQQFFAPHAKGDDSLEIDRYTPVILGAAKITFKDSKLGIDESRDVLCATPISESAVAVDWDAATVLDVRAAALTRTPVESASFGEVPAAALQARNYTNWEKAFSRWLSQGQRIEVFRQPDLKLTSRAGESERDFKIRLQDTQRQARDAAVDSVRKKFAARQAQLAEKLRRAEAAVAREQDQASQQKLQTMVSAGATLFGALFGHKTISVGTLGRATTVARGVGRSMKETEDIKRAGENLEAVRTQVAELEEEIQRETKNIAQTFDSQVPLERVTLSPKRGQVAVLFVALGWMPLPAADTAT